jgi:hypothetical protein
MSRAIILPIFRSIRLCDTACGIMHSIMWPALRPLLPDNRPATYWVHYTTSYIVQSNAPEDGQNSSPKRVELIGIINKQLLLHLVGCLLYYLHSYEICCSNKSVYKDPSLLECYDIWICKEFPTFLSSVVLLLHCQAVQEHYTPPKRW